MRLEAGVLCTIICNGNEVGYVRCYVQFMLTEYQQEGSPALNEFKLWRKYDRTTYIP